MDRYSTDKAIANLKILLQRLEDYARKLNAGNTPTPREIAQAQVVRNQINLQVEKLRDVLNLALQRDIKEGVERIVEGSTGAVAILDNLLHRLR